MPDTPNTQTDDKPAPSAKRTLRFCALTIVGLLLLLLWGDTENSLRPYRATPWCILLPVSIVICFIAGLRAGDGISYRMRWLSGFLQALCIIRCFYMDATGGFFFGDPVGVVAYWAAIAFFYPIGFMFLSDPVIWAEGTYLDRPALRQCTSCGYSLIGLTENRCPECGEPFDAARLAELTPPAEAAADRAD